MGVQAARVRVTGAGSSCFSLFSPWLQGVNVAKLAGSNLLLVCSSPREKEVVVSVLILAFVHAAKDNGHRVLTRLAPTALCTFRHALLFLCRCVLG